MTDTKTLIKPKPEVKTEIVVPEKSITIVFVEGKWTTKMSGRLTQREIIRTRRMIRVEYRHHLREMKRKDIENAKVL